jgi:hypothetical protein
VTGGMLLRLKDTFEQAGDRQLRKKILCPLRPLNGHHVPLLVALKRAHRVILED